MLVFSPGKSGQLPPGKSAERARAPASQSLTIGTSEGKNILFWSRVKNITASEQLNAANAGRPSGEGEAFWNHNYHRKVDSYEYFLRH